VKRREPGHNDYTLRDKKKEHPSTWLQIRNVADHLVEGGGVKGLHGPVSRVLFDQTIKDS